MNMIFAVIIFQFLITNKLLYHLYFITKATSPATTTAGLHQDVQ